MLYQGWGVVDVVMPGCVGLVVLDEVDAVDVGLLVDVLQRLQDDVTLGTVFIIWKMKFFLQFYSFRKKSNLK